MIIRSILNFFQYIAYIYKYSETILIAKLKNYGVKENELEWFTRYLRERIKKNLIS